MTFDLVHSSRSLPPPLPATKGQKVRTRRAAAAAEIGTAPSIGFWHSAMASLCLPRSAPTVEQRVYEQRIGRAWIRIEAGSLPGPDGLIQEQPLPFGCNARHLILWINKQVVMTGSPKVDMGPSSAEWHLKCKGHRPNGKENHRLGVQIRAICSSRITVGWGWDPGGFTNSVIVSRGIVQKNGWIRHLEISESYFKALQTHLVPLDMKAMLPICNNSTAMDIYSWLAYRLHGIKEEEAVEVPWTSLMCQFGQGYLCIKDFKKQFKQELGKALAVYPAAGKAVEVVRGGLQLRKALPPIQFKPSTRELSRIA